MGSRSRRPAAARPRDPAPAPVAASDLPSPALLRFAPLVAAACAVLAYAPSLRGGFLYDDVPLVLGNRRLQDLSALGTVLRYEPARPLLGLVWALNRAVSGTEPFGYHLVNVLIHAANAALVASVLLWIAAPSRAGRGRDLRGAAVLGAVLFAITPMAAETVAYVASRSTALSALFVLASLRVLLPALESPRPRRVAWGLLLFVLGLLTKEEAAALPFLLVLVDALFVARGARLLTRHRAAVYAPLAAVLVLGLAGRRLATGAWLPGAPVGHLRYAVTQVAAFPGYLLRAILPFDPALFRGRPVAPWPLDVETVALGLVAVGLGVLAVWSGRRLPLVSFAIGALAAGLLPSSSIVPLNEMVVDHRAYLGSIGVAFLVGSLGWPPERRLAAAFLALLLVARAWHFETVLADPVRAWEDAVRRAPASGDARRALAEAYASRGDPRALRTLEETVSLDADDARSWANLGVLYAQSGRLAEAQRALAEAVRAAPRDAKVHDNLGLVLEATGQEDAAREQYAAAALLDPRLAQPRIRLAALLLKRGERDGARRLLDEAAALEIDPEDAREIETLRGGLR